MRDVVRPIAIAVLATLAWAGPAPSFAKPHGKVCGGIAGLPCDKGSFCEMKTGVCGKVSDAQGHCVKRPQICNKIFMPVCGCDKKTYGNNCDREAAGVSEAHSGACTKK